MIEHNFKKKFGQNFLQDNNIIKKIVESAKIDENSLIIEIGPGGGALTKELVTKGTVIAYEIDTELKEHLYETFKEVSNVEFIFDDFLKRNIKEDIKKYNYDKLYVVANLPYYITTPIINKLIDEKIELEKIVVMVQKEVGDRFNAKPNTKNYNSLSIFIQYNYNVRKLIDVSKNVFIPKPNVDSIVIEMSKKEKAPVKNIDLFYKLIKDSFTQKRKTIKNNLKNYNLIKIEEVLKKYGYDLTVRAEQLPIEIFIEISNNLS